MGVAFTMAEPVEGALAARSGNRCGAPFVPCEGAEFARDPTPAPAADAVLAARPVSDEPFAPVVGRFAPSPTGRMHLGNIMASLLAWLSVRSQGGKLILRIEDLDDRARSGPWADLLMDDLRWLGLHWDEGPYYQTGRLDLYEAALTQLEDLGLLYPCFCTRAELHAASAPHASDGTPIYVGTCRGLTPEEVAERSKLRPPALRLRVPAVRTAPRSAANIRESLLSQAKLPDSADFLPRELTLAGYGTPPVRNDAGPIRFEDRTYGPQQEVLAQECGDFLVRRSDGVFAYQLAVVVDDAAMGVTEVVRGCDLLGSTARQLYLQDLLGYKHPEYAHVPLLVAPDGRRLSKRDRDLDMGELRARFDTPEALLGKLACAVGLRCDAAPCSAERLVDGFTWDWVREHPGDIVVAPGFLG